MPIADTSTLRGRTPFTHIRIPLAGGDYIVPMPQAEFGVLEFTGAIGSSACNVKLPPADGHAWILVNSTTGTGTMTAITTAEGSTGPVIPQGSAVPVWEDGVNVYGISASNLSGAGTLTGTELVTLGTFPAPPQGIGNGSSVIEITVGSSSSVTLDASVATFGPIVRFLGATQDFTSVFPITGPYNRWLVWNDTDFFAALTCPVSSGGPNTTHTVVMPPRTQTELAVVNESSGDARIVQNFAQVGAFSGGVSVTVPNAATYTFSDVEASAQVLGLTGGNQAATLTLPTAASLAGRLWWIWNTTSFLMTVKAGSDPGTGVPIADGAAAFITIDLSGRTRQLGPQWDPTLTNLVPAPTVAGITWAGNSVNVSWATLRAGVLHFNGGSATSTVTATWPAAGTGLAGGQAWVCFNNCGQLLELIANGGSSPVYLQSGDRAAIYYDGTELRKSDSGYVQAPSGAGANQNGTDLFLAGGQNTGAGTPGAVHIQVSQPGSSGSAVQSLYDKLQLADNLGSFLQLHAGTGDVFQVRCIEAATSGSQLRSLPGIYYRGYYWNGAASTAVDVGTDLNLQSTSPHYQWRVITGGNPRIKVGEAGQIILAATSAAPDADLQNGDMTVWFDSTHGAAKFNIKGKDASGTIVNGSVNLT